MKPKILLVEDDPSVHDALATLLRGEGYEVLSAVNAAEAMQAYQNVQDVNLVLLDLNLPEESGWELFERLVRLDPRLPIVVITARPHQETLAESAGAAAFMEKPLNLPLLLDMIARLTGPLFPSAARTAASRPGSEGKQP